MSGFLKRLFSGRDRARRHVDPTYYRASYPDVAQSGADPFQHFMEHGWREGRNPSARFNTLYYRDRHLEGANTNPLVHYLDIGLREGLSTVPQSDAEFLAVQRPLVSPHFEPSYYLTQTGPLTDDPLAHYQSTGWRQGKAPNARFSPARYHEQHAFLVQLSIDPLYHFASQNRMRDGATSRVVQSPIAEVPLQRILAVIGPEFDRAFYTRTYPDVAKAGLDPLLHYASFGGREGRKPTATFHGAYYFASNPDVARAGLNPFYHYLTQGRAEGRPGNPVGRRLYPPLAAPAPEAWEDVVPAAATADAAYVVIMPVYKGYDETLAAIHAVLSARQAVSFALHVIDDVTPDPRLERMLRALADRGLFSYARNETNLGFVKSVNRGLRLFADKEVVLLNSDAQVFGDWLDRIDRHAKSDSMIATITPMSNNATICSYPVSNENNVIEPECSAQMLDRMASVCNTGRVSDIPTGVGFCFYMSRASRDLVGIFDEDAFGKGYGEENDFCLRAAKAGFRNVLGEDIFVFHAGQVSFAELMAEEYGPGQAALLRKHPDYPQRIQQFLKADTSERGRMRLDLYRLAAALPNAMVFISHAQGGGITTHVADMEAALREDGIAIIHVRVGVGDRWSLDIASYAPSAPFCPNLRPTAVNQIRPLLIEFLDWLRPSGIHVHSLVGLDWQATITVLDLVKRSGIPYYFTLHDYSVVCHRNDLVPPSGRFCGLPDVEVCQVCVASDRSYPEAIDPEVRRQTYYAFLAGAEAVFAPSHDIKARLSQAGADYPIVVRPHASHDGVAPCPKPMANAATMDVVTIGAIGLHKGSRVLLNLARDAKARALPIRFHIIGYSDVTDDMRQADVVESGRYDTDAAAVDLIRAIRPACVFLPSIWPETFCYALSMAFDLEIPPVVFDLGAQRDRVREAGYGFVLPYALIDDVQGLNDRLLTLPYRAATAPRSLVTRRLSSLDYYS